MGNSPKETSVVPGISVTILKRQNAKIVGVLVCNIDMFRSIRKKEKEKKVYTTRTVDVEFYVGGDIWPVKFEKWKLLDEYLISTTI